MGADRGWWTQGRRVSVGARGPNRRERSRGAITERREPNGTLRWATEIDGSGNPMDLNLYSAAIDGACGIIVTGRDIVDLADDHRLFIGALAP